VIRLFVLEAERLAKPKVAARIGTTQLAVARLDIRLAPAE
jgi:hypothetical protein